MERTVIVRCGDHGNCMVLNKGYTGVRADITHLSGGGRGYSLQIHTNIHTYIYTHTQAHPPERRSEGLLPSDTIFMSA